MYKRQVEYQRYVVRSANGGYSAIIDAHGQVLQEGTLGAFETLSAQVPLLTEETIYAKISPWLSPIILLLLLLLWLPNGHLHHRIK